MTLILAFTTIAPAVATPDVRCPSCHRLLFRGVMVGEIMCGRCNALVRFGAGVLESLAT